MSGTGTGYDFSTTTFSPEGKIFQVEYASKAVENSGTCIALRTRTGVVFAVEKLFTSKLLVPGSDRRIFTLESHIGIAGSGLVGDIRHLFHYGRREAENYKRNYRTPISVSLEADRIASYVHLYTLYPVRPFGISAILGGIDSKGPQLFLIEPSGVCYGYLGATAGKARQAAKTEIEKLDLNSLEMENAVIEAAKIIYKVHDENKDKLFELELAWICPESGNEFSFVPQELYERAVAEGIQAVREAEEIEEE